jgi:hypothetical protein
MPWAGVITMTQILFVMTEHFGLPCQIGGVYRHWNSDHSAKMVAYWTRTQRYQMDWHRSRPCHGSLGFCPVNSIEKFCEPVCLKWLLDVSEQCVGGLDLGT